MYDLLVQAGKDTPVVGNTSGSYLTMKSNQGLVFGAATILSGQAAQRHVFLPTLMSINTGFSGVFCDQGKSFIYHGSSRIDINIEIGYWQRVGAYRCLCGPILIEILRSYRPLQALLDPLRKHM